MTEENLKNFKEKLEQEKEDIEKDLYSFAHKKKGDNEEFDVNFPDFGDGMTENANEVELYSEELPLEKILQQRLRELDEALERIKNKTYGKCEVCGKDIELERLMANPAAKTDMQHLQDAKK